MAPESESGFLSRYRRADFLGPLTTVDTAIFGIVDGDLSVLLIQRPEHPARGRLALPGGFIDEALDVDIAATAHRKLLAKTGVISPYLEQVETVGNATRDPRGWSLTVLFFALIDHAASLGAATLGQQPEKPRWVPVTEAVQADLAFDHSILLDKSLARLRNKTRYSALPLRLMPTEFTLGELQRVFEIVLGSSLEKKSFRRRVDDAGLIVETGGRRTGSHRPAALFRIGELPDDFVFPRPLEA
jgi:8-oxo-dGTP diphosphatase